MVVSASDLLNDDLYDDSEPIASVDIPGTDKYRVLTGADAYKYQLRQDELLSSGPEPTTPTTSTVPANPEPTPMKTPWGRCAKSEATLWRHKPDGSYDDGPKDLERYFREYYQRHRATKVQCELCGRAAALNGMRRHKRSILCARAAKRLEN